VNLRTLYTHAFDLQKVGQDLQSDPAALFWMELAAKNGIATDGGCDSVPAVEAVREQMSRIVRLDGIRVHEIH
jgi:hypothetical protein